MGREWGRVGSDVVRLSTLLTVATVAMLTLCGLLSGLLESFLVPVEVLPGLSVATLAAVPLNYWLARAGKASGWRWGGLLAMLAWFAVVMVGSTGRPEGDIVILGTAGGLLFLFLGTVAGAVGLARRPRPEFKEEESTPITPT